MKVEHVRVSPDNYAYLLIDEKSKKAVSFDIFDVPKVMSKVPSGVQLVAAITTHHHPDHSGGNKAFLKKYPDTHIYGGYETGRDDSKLEPADGPIDLETASDKPSFFSTAPYTKFIKQDTTFKVGSIEVKCLSTPCHTQDSICFFAKDTEDPSAPAVVFTGDTLFVSGCGRFFEGDGAQMHASLSKLGALPDDTIVYVGHEYTASNLKFALSLDPENKDLARLQKLVDTAPVEDGKPVTTGISTISDEKLWNLFMRLDTKAVREGTKTDSSTSSSAVMDALRTKKDNYK